MQLYGLPLWCEVWENTIGDIAAHVSLPPSSPSIAVGWLWVVVYCNAVDPSSLVKHGAVFVWKTIPGNCTISNNSISILIVWFFFGFFWSGLIIEKKEEEKLDIIKRAVSCNLEDSLTALRFANMVWVLRLLLSHVLWFIFLWSMWPWISPSALHSVAVGFRSVFRVWELIFFTVYCSSHLS